MTTNNIKTEIIEFTRKLNTEMLPSMAFNSKKAALDAIEYLTKLLSTIAEDEMKAAFDMPATSEESTEDENNFDDFYDPADDFSEDDIKSHISDPFGNDSLTEVLESINPDFDKNKLSSLKETTVGQYLNERLAYSFVATLMKIAKLDSKDPSYIEDVKKLAAGLMKKTVTDPSVESKDRDDTLNINDPKLGFPTFTSEKHYLTYFMDDIKDECGRAHYDYKNFARNAAVVNTLTDIYKSYLRKDISDEDKKKLAAKISLVLSI